MSAARSERAGVARRAARGRLLLVLAGFAVFLWTSSLWTGAASAAGFTTDGPFLRTSAGVTTTPIAQRGMETVTRLSAHEVESGSGRVLESRAFAHSVESGLLSSRRIAAGSSARTWEQMSGSRESTGPARNPHLQSIGLSILLPGLAQYKMGHTWRAAGYFAAEAACWTAFGVYRVQGSNREDSYHQMAELFAGVQNPGSKDDDYYKTIAGWPSSELYNEIVVRRNARQAHGDDLAAREAYYESNRIQGDEAWSWVSEAARERYRDKRNDAQRSFKNSRNMIGLAVANRVVAMIDAVLLERRHSNLRVELVPDRESQGARISISRAVP